MPDTRTSPVTVARDNHTLVITIDRPEARNAIDAAVTIAIGDAMAAAEDDRDIRAVVLTGSGDKSFCAGADLKAIARGETIVPEDGPRAAWGFAGYVTHHISKPTIAAVNGAALGGGTELVLASDLAVASTTAVFGLPEVKRGIIAGAGGVFRLPRQIPRKLAYELMFTGDSIDAERALHLGLVNYVVSPDSVLDRALELAHNISANAPLAVQASKRVAQHIIGGNVPSDADAWQLSARERASVRNSDDAKEGPRAFAEKRAPVWSGK
ncbi:crotonase/enoyl-CoA hydratase family protein [Rhodococcus sp. ZPP]|uniref:crotonase/enoyl-CoA hydratase family protein n=1 Tax=Rhodococcus sp. ZPP TaxID=2749906 RepID=UPI001AD88785|nr:crotonase/enoyl-CoA hydratase family protein [Rhodococcus sp. ZPP]QTJ68602.1 crotonase/enoyl-CoA hydratase family protein [Rhodococcus sp. ZPP]